MEFRILGPLEVVERGAPLPLGGPQQRAVLCLLLLRANQVVSADRLIDELWGEQPPPTAAKTLRVYVSRLRKLLRARLPARGPGYVIRVDEDELDLARCERLRERARELAPAEAAETMHEALALWRGPPLADFAYEPWAQGEIARLEELRLACLEERIDADLATGRHAELVGELEQLVASHPLRERLRGQLMLALYRSGRQAEALQAYQVARTALVEELGIDRAPTSSSSRRRSSSRTLTWPRPHACGRGNRRRPMSSRRPSRARPARSSPSSSSTSPTRRRSGSSSTRRRCARCSTATSTPSRRCSGATAARSRSSSGTP